jgi:hypothetical protein
MSRNNKRGDFFGHDTQGVALGYAVAAFQAEESESGSTPNP